MERCQLTPKRFVSVLSGIALLCQTAIAYGQAPPYQTPQGQACIDRWIAESMSKLNAYKGSADFNARKPWSINRYGIIEGNPRTGPTSVFAPDDFKDYGNNKYWYMWNRFEPNPSAGWRIPEWNGAKVEGLQGYVAKCVAAASLAGTAPTGAVRAAPPATGPAPTGPSPGSSGQGPPGSGGNIEVVSGTYGGNCAGVTRGNVTAHLAGACNGKAACDYKVDVTVIGDPAFGCMKTYVAEWRCGGDPTVQRAEIGAEAGYGSIVRLQCPAGAAAPAGPASGAGLPPYGTPEPANVSGLTLQASQRRVIANETVNVPFYLINGANVANINFEVTYNASIARPEGTIGKGNLLDNALLSSNANAAGIIRAGFADTRGVSGTGTVLNVPFRAVGKPGERTRLDLAVTTVNDPNGGVLKIDRIPGEIVILDQQGRIPGEPPGTGPGAAGMPPGTPATGGSTPGGSGTGGGDCDGDGRVTTLDARCALEMSVQLIAVRLTLDMDNSNDVTSRDAVLLLNRAVGK